MSVRLHWYLPTDGDGRTLMSADADLVERTSARAPTVAYLGQVARSAEQAGFHSALLPTGTWCEDAWLLSAALSQVTERLTFLVAFRPGLTSPTLAAQMAASFQRISGGRLAVNVVTGGSDAEQRSFGDRLSKDERYARTDEFLTIVRGAAGGEPFDFAGRHYAVEGAVVRHPAPLPPIYFGGSSDAALPVAARHADVYLTWGEPPDQVAEKIGRVRALAAALGRRPRFGVRMHIVTRDTSAAAWESAARLLDGADAEAIAAIQEAQRASGAEGQRRMRELHGGRLDRLEVYPNVWAGVGLLRGGAGTALVGSHAEVADRIAEYHALGIEEFVLSGYPHLEEAHHVGEGVFPLLRERGLLDPAGTQAALALV